jgi:release factor glutamine methyltransferase
MDVRSALSQSAGNLEKAGIPSARLDAEVLLSFVLGCDRLEFYKNPATPVGETQLVEFRKVITRRLRWEPVAYITGLKEFWTFTLKVNKEVLIPRPDTEVIVEEALNICRKAIYDKPRILDIGTGSGAIALALAKEIPGSRIVATDISFSALGVAADNARNLRLNGQIDFRQGNLFDPVEGLFDIIISNPPYIPAAEYENLPSGVKDYEPREALLAGCLGTEFYALLVSRACNYLNDSGWLLLEIGATQEPSVSQMIESAGMYDSIDLRVDYAGHPRVIRARRKV